MLKLTVYIPDSHLEPVKAALFAAGAGRIGSYDGCVWQVLGQGQFRPCDGARPFIGDVGSVTVVPEWRVEMVLDESVLEAVIAALKTAHPYETPAYDVVAVLPV